MKKLIIKSNSKEVNGNDIFVCTTNEKIDRHYFISDIYKTSKKIVVNKKYFKAVKDTNKYFYKSIKKHYHYPKRKVKIIGITGTDGKTTCATIIYDLLNNFITCSYLGTNGFKINGYKETTKNTTPSIEIIIKYIYQTYKNKGKYLIMEASSEGLYYERCKYLKFYRCLLTNITGDHLNTHKTMDNYINTKLKLFSYTRNISFLNKDDKYYNYFKKNIKSKIITYGINNSDYMIKNIYYKDSYTYFDLVNKHKTYHIKSPLIGIFNVYNLTLAIALLNSLNIKTKNILKYIPNLKQAEGRMNFLDYKQDYKILLDYAHTTNATKEVLTTLNNISHNKIITVLGCAGGREKDKRKDIGLIATSMSSLVIFTMDDPRTEDVNDIIKEMLTNVTSNNYLIINDRNTAINKALELAVKNDIVAILGKGNDNYMAVGNNYIKYCDKDVIDTYFQNKK